MRHSIAGAVLALTMAAAFAQDVVIPNPNLLADGIPAISRTIADQVALYTEFRGYGFAGWHPVERSMLVRHREQGANIAQIYWLKAPGGKLEKITDFPDPVSAPSFAPHHGNYIVYGRDGGGGLLFWVGFVAFGGEGPLCERETVDFGVVADVDRELRVKVEKFDRGGVLVGEREGAEFAGEGAG